ncbi:uncharacterized protein LOC126037503 [Accipiter gentilis]|uniref:uncharacterized protein LOC126037503 n=1 Tax=Astur gentilis TaxID=8957 RepID=UPI00210FC3A8|nr:uncharacterized protein LOC126037503 [Accipiter gentilis]
MGQMKIGQWIENYSFKVKFLYEQLPKDKIPKWTPQDREQFVSLKKELSQAPVLSLPDLKRPFHLFVNIYEGTAFGVLTQEWAGQKKPVAYLSKLLDPVSRGWPSCLQIIVAAALLLEETNRITFNGDVILYAPHNIRGVLQQKAEKWLTDSRLLKYEGILIESPKLSLKTIGAINPAEFLYPGESNELLHNCFQTIEQQTRIRPDLEEEELQCGEILFIDGSSRIVEEHRNKLWERGLIVQRPPLDLKIHNLKPGDWVLIKTWKEETLRPNWEGPYLVLLTTETAVRTAERGWTHASRIKGPVTKPHWKVVSAPGDTKIILRR